MTELYGVAADARAPYRPLGSFRLLLALLVMVQHAHALLPEPWASALQPLEPGSMAVFAFFIVSGFVIAEAASAFYVTRPAAFLGNRLLRTVPTFVAALLVSAVVLSFAIRRYVPDADAMPITAEMLSAKSVLWNLLALFPVWKTVQSHVGVPELLQQGWALRVEFVFYLVLAGTLFLAPLLRTSLAILQTGTATAMLVLLAAFPDKLGPTMLADAPFFVFGVAYYHLLTRQEEQWFPASFCLAALAFMVANLLGQAPVFGASHVLRDRTGELILVMVLAAAFLLLARLDFGAGRSASSRLDRALGELTYPLYLLHACVMVAAQAWLPNHRWSSTFIAFGVSIAISVLAVAVIERPVARWRGRLRRREPSRTEPSRLRKGAALP